MMLLKNGTLVGMALACIALPEISDASTRKTPETALILGCDQDPSERWMKVSSKVVLNAKFLPKGAARDSFIHDAIQLQLMFAAGFLHNDEEFNSSYLASLSAYRERIKIISIAESKYSYSLQIDPFRFDASAAHPYVRAAVKSSKTSNADPAITIRYETRLKAALCKKSGTEAHQVEALSARVPPDPFLAMWYLAPQHRRPLTFFRNKATVPFCVKDEMASWGDSNTLWNHWNPRRKGKDANGEPFDCDAVIPVHSHTAPFHLKEEGLVASASGYLPLSDRPSSKLAPAPLKVSIIFGKVAEAPFLQLDAKLLEDTLAKGPASPDFQSNLTALSPSGPELRIEPGAMELILFLRWMGSAIQVEKIFPLSASATGLEPVRFELSGKLIESKRPIRLSVLYGSTSTYMKGGQMHWEFLRTALREDDVVIYNGHAGLGENFTLKSLARALNLNQKTLESEFRKKPQQTIVALSCYSYLLFGEDFAAARQGLTTNLVLSGTLDVGSKYILSLLKTLDIGAQENDKAGGKPPLARYVPAGTFLVVKGAGEKQAIK